MLALWAVRHFLLRVTAQLADRSNVLDVIGLDVGAHGETLWNPPEEDLRLSE